MSMRPLDEVLRPYLRILARPRPAGRGSGSRGTRPFFTIMRDSGARGSSVAHALADALNERGGEIHWQAFDRELVEKVAADHELSERLVASLEDGARSWLDNLIRTVHDSQFAVYRRVAETIRALAEAGGVIIVGRGGIFLTEDLTGGRHVRLVAPRTARIRRTMEKRNVSEAEADAIVREIDENRAAFYRQWWPGRRIEPELFAATLNTAVLGVPRVVRVLSSLADGELDFSYGDGSRAPAVADRGPSG